MFSAGFKFVIRPSKPLYTYTFDRVGTGIGKFVCLFLAGQPLVGQGLLTHKVSRSCTTTHYIQ